MSARAAPHLRTSELPRLARSAQTARPSTGSAAERRHNLAPTWAPQVDAHPSDSRLRGSPLGGFRADGWGFATAPSITGDLGILTSQTPLLSRGSARHWGGYGSSHSGKVSKRRGHQNKSKDFVPAPPPVGRMRGVDTESVQVVTKFGTRAQLAT